MFRQTVPFQEIYSADQSSHQISPSYQNYQSLINGIRQLLPTLRAEIADQLVSNGNTQQLLLLRISCTGAPNTLFDDTPISSSNDLTRRMIHETLFTYLLGTVFCESLRQSYDLQCDLAQLTVCIPELSAYLWFSPSLSLRTRFHTLLRNSCLSPIPVKIAEQLYEGSLSRDEKKSFGQYYTPLPLAEHLLDQVGYRLGESIVAKRLLDIATGFGVFLALAARRLARTLQNQGYDQARLFRILGENLQGYDIHPFAVIATKIYVLATVIEELRLDTNGVRHALISCRLPGIITADTLAQPFLCDEASRPAFVVGNPPYGTCRPGVHLRRYLDVLDGRANLYQLFLYFAVERCLPDGHIAFLMPESLRSGRYFTALRHYLSAHTRIRATTDVQARTAIFLDVEQGVLILSCQKKEGDEEDTTPVTVVQIANEERLDMAIPFQVDHGHVQAPSHMDSMLLKASGPDEYALLHRLCQLSPSQPCLHLQVHTGRFVWNQHNQGLHQRRQPDFLPVIYAQSVHRFLFTFPPEKNTVRRQHHLYGESVEHILRYATHGQVILLQRTTAREQDRRLIATLLPEDFQRSHPHYLVENHVNYIDGAFYGIERIPLLYVLGLLNSKLLNFLFAALNGNTHVSSWELRHLPLLWVDHPGLVQTVIRRLTASQEEAVSIEQTVDMMVYDIYGLSGAERNLVEQFHTHKQSRSGRCLPRISS